MRVGDYAPRVLSFNRLCHRLSALVKPEMRLQPQPFGITIRRDVLVPDTSVYEGLVNYYTMSNAGARGVICKASQGTVVDAEFHNTWTNAKDVLPRGAYHFYDPRVRPSLQVDTFVSLLHDDPGELPMVVDWEYGDSWGGSFQGWQNLYTFLEGLKNAIPWRPIMIYTGYYYWLDHSPNPITQAASLNYFAQYSLWLAWYTDNPALVRIPRPWDNLKFWQYSESGPGHTYGAPTNSIDLSWYNGTFPEYMAEFGMPLPEPPPNPPPVTPPGGTVTTYTGIVKASATPYIVVRRAGDGAKIGQVNPGVAIKGDGLQNFGTDAPWSGYTWMHLTSPIVGYVAAQNLTYTTDPVTPPNPPPTPVVLTPHIHITLTIPPGDADDPEQVWTFDADGKLQA